MSFNIPQTTPFIHIKLTNAGRRLLSLGNLTFNKAVISDREINYGIDHTGYYDITNNRVLAAADFYPDIDPLNLDGSNAVTLGPPEVASAKQYLTGDTPSAGFFSGSPTQWTLEVSKAKGTGTVAYTQTWNSTAVTIVSSYTAQIGDLIFIPWVPPQLGTNYMATNDLPVSIPANSLWYRIISGNSGTYTIDRSLPNFGAFSDAMTVPCYFYPHNAIETYYSSAATQDVKVWNMSIVRTNTLLGTDLNNDTISGYTRYGSIQYAGTKHFLGFDDQTPAIGFIHYTNMNTGNTYAEQFIEKSIQIYIPTIMWHNVSSNNGKGEKWGASFYDQYGDTIYDSVAKTTYRELRDGLSQSNKVIGRVYHKLKIMVITDQELLNAVSYKSNRSWTLPDFNVSLSPTPKYPLTNSNATGLCRKGYSYFVTYLAEADEYGASSSFGYGNSVPCGYIKKIDGINDINGNPQFLQITFQANGFPYMRNETDLGATGHGWSSNYIQVLVSEQPTLDDYEVGSVPANSWKRMSDKSAGGNGVYRASDDGDNTIDPAKLNSNTFVVSQEDYVSGSTYSIFSACTQYQDTLNFGDENFFFGVVDLQIFATTYKSVITVTASNELFNTSVNDTFDANLNEDTYISEVAILNENNEVVAIGKPTTPLKKNNGRYLAFQLEIDY